MKLSIKKALLNVTFTLFSSCSAYNGVGWNTQSTITTTTMEIQQYSMPITDGYLHIRNFSDNLAPILHNIEQNSLPNAHAELVHLDTQIKNSLEKLNITDPVAQKECIEKSLGRDVTTIAHKTYEARLDHKKLVASFTPIDMEKATVTILENNNTYEAVANEMSNLTDHVLVNARLCKLDFVEKIEHHILDSLHIIETPENDAQFIFNVTVVDHLLTDLQHKVNSIVKGKSTSYTRGSELFNRAMLKFLDGINPITQISNTNHLIADLGSLLKKSGTALWNDPIAATHNGITTTFTLIELIRNTADFTSDLTVEKLYLSPEEYKQRTDAFYKIIEPLQGVTAEHYVDFVAQLTADVVFFKGLGTAYNFLKEIDALSKLGESAAAVSRIFKKGFDTHLANDPIVITAEGVVLKMSNGMKDFNKGPREIINSAKALLESVYAPIADALKTEVLAMQKIYDRKKEGFAQIINKITMEYKHILGMELDLSKKGKLTIGGFHHDLENIIEKTDILRFTNRTSYGHGFYKATLFDGENFVKNVTFFPAEWSRDTVIQKTYEAYDNFIKKGATGYIEQGNKYVIRGKIKEGIEIEMYITKNGNIVTAYPILEGF